MSAAELEAWKTKGWKEEAQDPARLEDFLHHTMFFLRTTTPGLTADEKAFTPVAVTTKVSCKSGRQAGWDESTVFVGDPWEGGVDPKDNYGPEVRPVLYCPNYQPRTILYSVEGMRQELGHEHALYPQEIVFSFAHYLADPEGVGLAKVSRKAMGCAEGRVMYGLLKAGFIEDKFDLYGSPWMVKDEYLAAFNAAVVQGHC
jgi:catechol 2,3-dioxygenase-like lactoylglutathione lyase family enzyme